MKKREKQRETKINKKEREREREGRKNQKTRQKDRRKRKRELESDQSHRPRRSRPDAAVRAAPEFLEAARCAAFVSATRALPFLRSLFVGVSWAMI